MKEQAYLGLRTLGVIGICSLFSSCGGGSTIDNSALITSTSLNVSAAPGFLRLFVDPTVNACSASTLSCTPGGFKGRVYSAGASLGGQGEQEEGFNMTFLADSEEVIQDPSKGSGGTIEFDVSTDDPVSGKAAIPGEGDMPSNPIVDSIEFKFDYLDSTFKLAGTSGGAADETYIVRTVFVKEGTAADVSGSFYRGDKLVKLASDTTGKFKWCDSTGCSHETRPTSPLQIQSLVDWQPRPQGGEYYAIVDFEIPSENQKTFDYATLSNTALVWKVDLDVTDVIEWGALPSTFSSIKDVVSNFSLKYDSDDSTSLSASFDIVESSSI